MRQCADLLHLRVYLIGTSVQLIFNIRPIMKTNLMYYYRLIRTTLSLLMVYPGFVYLLYLKTILIFWWPKIKVTNDMLSGIRLLFGLSLHNVPLKGILDHSIFIYCSYILH